MGEGDLDFDWGALFSGNESPDLSSSGIDFSQIGGDYGGNLSDELAAALSGSGNSSSLFSGDGGIDLSSLMDGVGDLDQAAPPTDIADLLKTKMWTDTGNPETTWENYNRNVVLNGLDESNLNKLSPEDRARYEAMKAGDSSARDELMAYGKDRIQDFGGADVTKYLDEFNENFNPAGGYGSQWQMVGTNRVMVNDDGTATILNPTTGESSYLDKDQTDALVKNGTLNTKGSGYVDATGGTGYVPGGGKTILNSDGTKSVIGTDGKVYTITKDGKVIDTGKTVNVNDKSIETKTIKEIIDNTKKTTGGGGGTPTKPAAKDNSGMLMALLALMAMMNKGGGSSGGSSAVIPSLAADRKQLPYGPAAGLPAARPGAGGVTYFSPTTYTQRAAGGGMMYGGGGISDLGGYSDGGRLLKGPGDGVSDSIPATIGGKQPARLAEGEFVVPARIVSELGNGSTDAGAQKLYAMMDRVQNARRKTKNVAADTKAHKYLPA